MNLDYTDRPLLGKYNLYIDVGNAVRYQKVNNLDFSGGINLL